MRSEGVSQRVLPAAILQRRVGPTIQEPRDQQRLAFGASRHEQSGPHGELGHRVKSRRPTRVHVAAAVQPLSHVGHEALAAGRIP